MPTSAILYARTSTDDQHNGVEAQRDRLVAYAEAQVGWTFRMEVEHASGKTLARRPILRNALARLDKLGTDGVLVVTRLDRLARSVVDFANILARSQDRGWAIVVLDMQLDTSNAVGRMAAGIAMQFAQFEREIIGERTREALAVVKANGVPLGRPSVVPTNVRARIVDMRDIDTMSWRRIADTLNADGVPGPRGPVWHPTAVRRVYDTATKEAK